MGTWVPIGSFQTIDWKRTVYGRKITKGAAALDLHFGHRDWRLWIDLDNLNLGHPRYCVLAQLFGTYLDGMDKLGIVHIDCMRFAFIGDPNHSDFARDGYATMNQEWKDYISTGKVVAE